MAPSRALARCASTVSVHLRSTPRLLSPACRIHTTNTALVLSRSLPALRLASLHHPPAFSTSSQLCSQTSSSLEPPDYLNEAELHVFKKITAELQPVKLEVQDISGGCGSMYALEIESPKFKGLSVIKQHKMVNAILADEIKSWHGVQLRTKAV